MSEYHTPPLTGARPPYGKSWIRHCNLIEAGRFQDIGRGPSVQEESTAVLQTGAAKMEVSFKLTPALALKKCSLKK